MAAPAKPEIDKADLKKLLTRSKKEPVNCAIGLASDSSALIMLDKIKQPRAVARKLEDEYSDVKNQRWGTASVDIDADPKLVLLTINKPAPGFARKMKKTLRGNGFTKVRVMLEGGCIDEEDMEDEEAAEPAAASSPEPVPSAPAPKPVPQPPQPAAPPPPTPLGLDFGALTRRMTELVKRLVQSDPALRNTLKPIAGEAQAAIKAQSPDAPALLDRLEAAISGTSAEAAPAPTQTAPTTLTPAAAPPATARTMPKARMAWAAARHHVQGELDKLTTAMAKTYQDHGFATDLGKMMSAKVEPMLDQLDDSLAHKLDEVAANTDLAQHPKLVAEAQQITARYADFIDTEPMIAKLDANPFVPLHIRAALDVTLSTLSKVLERA